MRAVNTFRAKIGRKEEKIESVGLNYFFFFFSFSVENVFFHVQSFRATSLIGNEIQRKGIRLKDTYIPIQNVIKFALLVFLCTEFNIQIVFSGRENNVYASLNRNSYVTRRYYKHRSRIRVIISKIIFPGAISISRVYR